MNQLSKSLEIADGYLSLGMPDDAWETLEDLKPEDKATLPAILMRIQIYQTLGKWSAGSVLAESLVRKQPEKPEWWLLWANCLRRGKDLEGALGVAREAVEIHPTSAKVIYDLACYTCLSGETEKAGDLLEKAFTIDGSLRATALEDPDLDPLFGGASRPS